MPKVVACLFFAEKSPRTVMAMVFMFAFISVLGFEFLKLGDSVTVDWACC